ncbi:MAG: S41 family peptidase [Leptospirillia bacterium]
MTKQRTKRGGGLSLLILAALLMGCLVGYSLDNRVMAQGSSFEQLKVFSEVLAHIQNQYVEEVDSEELLQGAIRGMMDTLDPHSSYMKRKNYEELQVDTKGEFGGLGIHVSVRDKKLVVISPIEDTPAFRAGIESGDHILKVEGKPTKDMTISEAVELMRGKKGTEVVITIVREGPEGPEKPFDVTIVRDVIKVPSVRSRMIEPGIGYIRLTQFQERSGPDLKDHLKRLQDDGMESLVLDLRNNPGGLLTSAVEVAELFLDDGELVVYIQNRKGDREEYYAHVRDGGTDFPLVVLVNGGSASASEIVSGAMQDLGRAVIMGTVSFGKGSVQTVMPLSDESGLRLTTAKYYTASGRTIHGNGITPDIVVQPEKRKITEAQKRAFIERRDRQLDGKKEGALPGEEGAPAVEETDPDEPKIGDGEEDEKQEIILTPEEERYLGDNQLQEAINLLKGWRILQGTSGLMLTAGG